MKSTQLSLSRSKGFIDKVGFTVPLSGLASIDKIYRRMDNLYDSKKYHVEPWKGKQVKPYKKGVAIYLDDALVMQTCWSPPNRMALNPIKFEFNPANKLEKDRIILAELCERILGKEYPAIWNSANITRLDATFDVFGCDPDYIVVNSSRCKEQKIKLDGKGKVASRKYGSSKSARSLSVYAKGKNKKLVSRVELRLKPYKFYSAEKCPKGLKNMSGMIQDNPFSDISIFSGAFAQDRRFEPGFYDCVRNHGLSGALAHYAEWDKSIPKRYLSVLREAYNMDLYDPTEIWAGVYEDMGALDCFKP